MREIKFEYVIELYQDNKKIETIISDPISLEEIEEDGIGIFIENTIEAWEKENGSCSCFNEGQSFCECEPISDDYKIIARRGFAGLKDKNEKEIYEGDIVKAIDYNPENYLIEFIEGGFCATFKDLIPIDINHFYPSLGCCIEIIGNIYENPELLELDK